MTTIVRNFIRWKKTKRVVFWDKVASINAWSDDQKKVESIDGESNQYYVTFPII